VDVEIRSSGDPFVLATSTFVFDYDTIALANPTKVAANDGPWDNTDGDYANVAVISGSSFVSLIVEFNGTDDYDGTTIPSSYTRIGTVRFTISDASRNSGLQWRSIGSATQVFRITSPSVINSGETDITALGTFHSPEPFTLPVQLASIQTMVDGRIVTLRWTTATEVNNYGFEVERGTIINSDTLWTKSGFVQGAGTSASLREYVYSDRTVSDGRHVYRLKQIDMNGGYTYHYSSEVEVRIIPDRFVLEPNYPNPFNPSTTIRYGLPERSRVALVVHDILGQIVERLFDGEVEKGYHDVLWSPVQAASGVYFVVMQAEAISTPRQHTRLIRKILLVR